MGREFELKYAATAQVHGVLLDTYGPFRAIAMETTYFDTADGALSAQKMTLRLRKENEVTVCTLKAPLPQGGLGEWECEADELNAGLAQLLCSGAPAHVARLAEKGLIPVCGARFTRMAALLPTADGTAELALDSGVLLGGGKEMPLCEVELELKSGSDRATLALAAELAEKLALTPESKSKFRRAMDLAKGE